MFGKGYRRQLSIFGDAKLQRNGSVEQLLLTFTDPCFQQRQQTTFRKNGGKRIFLHHFSTKLKPSLTRGRYRIFQKGGGGGGGVGCRGYGYFILGHFIAGQIMRRKDKAPVDKMPMDKTPIKIAGEDKTLTILPCNHVTYFGGIFPTPPGFFLLGFYVDTLVFYCEFF